MTFDVIIKCGDDKAHYYSLSSERVKELVAIWLLNADKIKVIRNV